MSKLLKLILSPLIAAMAVSVVAGERVGDFALIDHQGAFHHMSWYDDHEAVVILAHANDAAGAQRALADLLALQGKYHEQGVVFFMSGQKALRRLPKYFPFPRNRQSWVPEAKGFLRQ